MDASGLRGGEVQPPSRGELLLDASLVHAGNNRVSLGALLEDLILHIHIGLGLLMFLALFNLASNFKLFLHNSHTCCMLLPVLMAPRWHQRTIALRALKKFFVF